MPFFNSRSRFAYSSAVTLWAVPIRKGSDTEADWEMTATKITIRSVLVITISINISQSEWRAQLGFYVGKLQGPERGVCPLVPLLSTNLISGSRTRRPVGTIMCGNNDTANGCGDDNRDDDVPLLMAGS